MKSMNEFCDKVSWQYTFRHEPKQQTTFRTKVDPAPFRKKINLHPCLTGGLASFRYEMIKATTTCRNRGKYGNRDFCNYTALDRFALKVLRTAEFRLLPNDKDASFSAVPAGDTYRIFDDIIRSDTYFNLGNQWNMHQGAARHHRLAVKEIAEAWDDEQLSSTLNRPLYNANTSLNSRLDITIKN